MKQMAAVLTMSCVSLLAAMFATVGVLARSRSGEDDRVEQLAD